jgi:NAD(P)H-hydrate epimerase
MSGAEVLTLAEMAKADRLAVAAGVPSLTLMENAGRAVADEIVKRWSQSSVAVLAGPGNNGGDGYVAARHLKERGYTVWIELIGDRSALHGDAAEMFKRWDGETRPVTRARKADIVVDAMYGAGLSRPLDINARVIAEVLNDSGTPVVAIDVPSGMHGDSGKVLGDMCVRATLTVTFFRKKPGHLLMPGRALCGEVVVADIGIPDTVLETIHPRIFENAPALWGRQFPWPRAEAHKYTRGHVVVVSGPAHATGAARLATRGALRVGAGLVSVAAAPDAVAVNAAHLTAIMVKPIEGAEGLRSLLTDKRSAVVIGPGAGVGRATELLVAAATESEASVVLDADALTSIASGLKGHLTHAHSRVVLTPHMSEFERLFPGLLVRSASKLDAARDAAALANCTVLLKGADTVIASPKGDAAINANAPPWLATAGSGDVLSGMIAGLMAQGMGAFDATCSAAWLHGEAANRFGMPSATITHRYDARDLAARDALVGAARRILREAGAAPVMFPYNIMTFSHAVGTVRLGADPARSPLDERGAFRGLDNLFVTDGSALPRSGGVNPSLTIAANALRTGTHIAATL